MKIGTTVAVQTKNLFSSYVLAMSEKGAAIEIPVATTGQIVEIKEESKTGYNIGVSFTFDDMLRGKQQMTLYFRPHSLTQRIVS